MVRTMNLTEFLSVLELEFLVDARVGLVGATELHAQVAQLPVGRSPFGVETLVQLLQFLLLLLDGEPQFGHLPRHRDDSVNDKDKT